MIEVIVGNIGCVYSGNNEGQAQETMNEYIRQSRTDYGRAGGENVTLMIDNEIKHEYLGTLEKEQNE